MNIFISIALIIIGVLICASVVLQSKGAGLGTMGGATDSTVFRGRRGIEKLLFQVTIGLGVVFFILAILAVSLK